LERAAQIVLDVAQSVLGELDLEVVLDRVLEGARELTGARYAAIGVLDAAQGRAGVDAELARFITAGIDDVTRASIGALPRGRGVLGELIRNPKPLRLTDVGSHPHSYGFPHGHPPMRTFLGVPVLVGGAPFGNLYLTEKVEREPFTDADEDAASMLAGIAGVAIENARRYTSVSERLEELERTAAALEVTTQISRAIGGQTDLDAILELVAKRGRAVIDARLLLIELQQDQDLVVAAGAGELSDGLIGRRVALEGTVADHALRTRRTQRLTDDLNRARFEEHGLGSRGVAAADGLVVPLIFRDQTYGVLLAVDRVRGGPTFSREDTRLLEAFAASAAIAVATARAVASDLQRLAAVVESSSDAILTVDRAGRITSWNRGAAALYGFAADEMLGTDGSVLLPEESAHERGILDGILLGGEVIKGYETTRLRSDRSVVEVSMSFSPIRAANGRVVGVASIARDMTERKQMERVLSQTQRLESLGQLAGGIAHDMNNLLAIILNYADFALESIADEPAGEEIREIRAAAERAGALVRQLLLFARQEAVSEQLLDVSEVVGELQKMLGRTLGEHIELRTALVQSPWSIKADRAQVEQVAMNLAVNARDAMPDGGTLTISTTNCTIEPGSRNALADHIEPGGYVCLEVSDTGIGMPAEVVSKAFEPFFTTKPTGSGTGLGLATVYGIVTKAGGSVRIDSESGRGTVVKAYWPVAQRSRHGEVSLVPSESADPTRTPAGETILLVEDEDALRAIATRLLRAEGYEVLAAGLPSAAIELAEPAEQSIDLLLTDLVMPGMPGAALVEHLHRTRPALPVVYMSGYVARSGDLPEGAVFVGKPFKRSELLAAVGRALDESVHSRAQSA
jgi:two-component system cell cycle sensor histidine kinase/response regulator CckA